MTVMTSQDHIGAPSITGPFATVMTVIFTGYLVIGIAMPVLPLHVQMSAWVPFADLLPTSLRHLPPAAIRTVPAGPWLAAVTCQVKETDPDTPPADALTVAW